MSYWVMNAEDVLNVLERRRAGDPVDLASHAVVIESDGNEDLVIEQVTQELVELVASLGELSNSSLAEFESTGCAIVHSKLKGLPSNTLLDPGFWRWVATGPLFDVVAWRFPSLHPNNVGGSFASFKRCVPYKLFLHGKIAFDGELADPYARADILGEDFWDSQILAVDNGYFPALSSAILDEVAELEATNDFARKAVRGVNRRRANQLPDILTKAEARQLVKAEFSRTTAASKGG